jgi:hypothetical protein
MGPPDHFDLFDTRGTQQESPLDTDTVRCGSSNGKICIVAAFSQSNEGAPKFLDPLAISFFDSHMHNNGITWMELWDVWVYRCLKSFHYISHHD